MQIAFNVRISIHRSQIIDRMLTEQHNGSYGQYASNNKFKVEDI